MSKIDLQALRGNQNEAFLAAAQERNCQTEADYLLTHRRPEKPNNRAEWPALEGAVRPLTKARIEAFCDQLLSFENGRDGRLGDSLNDSVAKIQENLVQAFDIAIQSEPGLAVSSRNTDAGRSA